jgi:hypothetical protein
MTNRLVSQTSGFNGERRTADTPLAAQDEPRAQRMFTLKGKVSSLKISDGSVDPQQVLYGPGIATLVDSTPYDKRIAVQHFICNIGGRAVTGTFPAVGFKNGDAVKVVVTGLDGVGVVAHAVMTTANGRLWLPHSVCKGTQAALIGTAKMALVASFIAWVCVLILMLQAAPKGGVFAYAALAAPLILALGALGVLLFNRATPQGAYADKILTMLGFSKPKMVDLAPFSERARNRKMREADGSPHVFHLWPALAAYGAVKRRK